MSARAIELERPAAVVRIGELRVARAGATLAAVGLGSCVAIALYDPQTRIGGLAHVLLPDPADARPGAPAGRFASTAVDLLVRQMERAGAGRHRIEARLAGGATMFDTLFSNGGRTLGARNAAAAREALARAGIPIRGEDLGGEHGRSVFFRLADGRVRVTSVRAPDVLL